VVSSVALCNLQQYLSLHAVECKSISFNIAMASTWIAAGMHEVISAISTNHFSSPASYDQDQRIFKLQTPADLATEATANNTPGQGSEMRFFKTFLVCIFNRIVMKKVFEEIIAVELFC